MPANFDSAQDYQIQIFEQDDAPTFEAVVEFLHEFNSSIVGPLDQKPFNLNVKDPSGKIVGGAFGYLFVNHDCFVHVVAVEKQLRRHGLGNKIFKAIEDLARANNCTNIRLETASFHAKPFYEKLGYVEITQVPQGFLGHTMYVMRKMLR